MAKFDDYINELEGKENLDPLTIASDLLALHNEEVGTRNAKITELEGTVAERDVNLADAVKETDKWKAKNFDLAMQIPGNPAFDPSNKPDATGNVINSPDDLFESGE